MPAQMPLNAGSKPISTLLRLKVAFERLLFFIQSAEHFDKLGIAYHPSSDNDCLSAFKYHDLLGISIFLKILSNIQCQHTSFISTPDIQQHMVCLANRFQ